MPGIQARMRQPSMTFKVRKYQMPAPTKQPITAPVTPFPKLPPDLGTSERTILAAAGCEGPGGGGGCAWPDSELGAACCAPATDSDARVPAAGAGMKAIFGEP